MYPVKISLIAISVFLLLLQSSASSGQSFSCFGKRAACLDFNDKIVNQNSTCFSNYTCGVNGFVCKDKFDSIFREYNELVGSYNDILSKNKKLVTLSQELIDENQRLVNDYNDLLAKYKMLAK